jgi:putative membrane protein
VSLLSFLPLAAVLAIATEVLAVGMAAAADGVVVRGAEEDLAADFLVAAVDLAAAAHPLVGDGSKMFTEKSLAQIEEAVTAAEKQTTGEIVPVYVRASVSYAWVHWFWFFFGVVLASIACLQYFSRHNWADPWKEIFIWQALGGLFFTALSTWSHFVRLTVPKKIFASEVNKAAYANFLAQGLHRTENRTGILIFISLLERRVVILGDEGIHKKVSDEFWKDQADEVAKGIAVGRAAEALISVIEKMGKTLALHFPATTHDKNELTDGLRGGRDF